MSWPMVKLHDICRPKQWKTIAASSLIASGYPVYGANGKIGFYSKFTHEFPTLMITCRGATCGNVHISEPMAYINGNAMALDDIDRSKVDIKYLYYFFLKRGFDDVISGSAQPQITGQGLTKVEIPLPPLLEQKRIAAILDKANDIRQKREQAVKLADDFLRATFLEMFGDPVANPKKWDVASLLEYGSFKNGMNFTKGESGSVLKCLGVGNFKSLATITCMDNIDEIELNTLPSDDYLLKDGDIVFVRSNGNKALVGRCLTIYPNKEKVTFSGFCIRYRIEKSAITAEYLNFLFRTPSMKQQMLSGGQGANIQNISQGTLSALRIPVPPLDKQLAFAKLVDFRASILKKQYDKMSESEKLFDALTGDFFIFNE
ncbi:restriction endonuclease subunit S [Serratia nevei]|uniref:restriction endonuclease subunit S n=1 Tax=Serratia nevei TaxID=2703794 RepID=UPI0011CBEB3C|nr:restriction endonuclease subunit S [Serratia nevei]TXE73952.1 restriction endonuclease subunit S [Serratia nevei]